jgi:hypothetical protein
MITVNQPFGLGDIIFVQNLIQLMRGNHSVTFPVADEYLWLWRYYPDVAFYKRSEYPIDYECAEVRPDFMPLRFSTQILRRLAKHDYSHDHTVMADKYILYGQDPTSWRDTLWVRDSDKELALFDQLGLEEGDEYTVVNANYGSAAVGGGTANLNRDSAKREVTLHPVPGFSLFDWGRVIEHATEVVTVETAVMWVMDALAAPTVKKRLHLRPNTGTDRSYTMKLLQPTWELVGALGA